MDSPEESMVIIGNLIFGWVRNLEASSFRGCWKNYEKEHGYSGQFFSFISREHGTHPEELEDDFFL